MTGSASRNSWVGFSSRPDDFAAKSAGTRLRPLFLTSHLGLDLCLIERLQQAFSDQPPYDQSSPKAISTGRALQRGHDWLTPGTKDSGFQ